MKFRSYEDKNLLDFQLRNVRENILKVFRWREMKNNIIVDICFIFDFLAR